MRPTLKPRICRPLPPLLIRPPHRTHATTSTRSPPPKPEGDISSVFASLSGTTAAPLPARFATLKDALIRGHEDKLRASWERLLSHLREETRVIREMGSTVIPEIRFEDIGKGADEEFGRALRKRGVGVVRGVVSEAEALGWKEEVRDYVRVNPQTKGRWGFHFFSWKLALYGYCEIVIVCRLVVGRRASVNCVLLICDNVSCFHHSILMLNSRRDNNDPQARLNRHDRHHIHFPLPTTPNHNIHTTTTAPVKLTPTQPSPPPTRPSTNSTGPPPKSAPAPTHTSSKPNAS